MKVGFIGLGKMGFAMANRLLAGGHQLAVYNRTAFKAAGLVEVGAIQLATAAETAAFGDVVITMLENDAALADVIEGSGEILSAMPKETIHVAMGTHSIALVKRLAHLHAAVGVQFVSAPVLGRPPAAAAGELGIIASGPPKAVATCQPLFDLMGRRTYDGGVEPVSAAAGKIVNNMILACAIEALGEGFALAQRYDLPANSLCEILTDGIFSSPAYKIYGKIIAEKDHFSSPGFSATTGLKDVLLALSAGEAVSMPLPSANICRDRLLGAIANGHGAADWSVMAHEQARAGGLVHD